METRNISVTLEQAREWYNSRNATLRTLALNAYTKEELELNYSLYSLIESKVDQACICSYIPSCEVKKFEVLAKLATIAKFYNKDWKKTNSNIGYFIWKYNDVSSPISISTSSLTQYAGVVYFKNYEDAVTAIKILGDEVRELFK